VQVCFVAIFPGDVEVRADSLGIGLLFVAAMSFIMGDPACVPTHMCSYAFLMHRLNAKVVCMA